MRKQYNNDFKAKVALEAISGHSIIQEIAKKYEVHPNLISSWKQEILNNASKLFENSSKDDKKKSLKKRRISI